MLGEVCTLHFDTGVQSPLLFTCETHIVVMKLAILASYPEAIFKCFQTEFKCISDSLEYSSPVVLVQT
jgi:hypothetical protein